MRANNIKKEDDPGEGSEFGGGGDIGCHTTYYGRHHPANYYFTTARQGRRDRSRAHRTHLELKPYPRGGIAILPSRLAVYVEQRQAGNFDVFLPFRYGVEDNRLLLPPPPLHYSQEARAGLAVRGHVCSCCRCGAVHEVNFQLNLINLLDVVECYSILPPHKESVLMY